VPRRLTNDLLLALLLAQVLTGLIGWAWPVARVAVLYDLHRVLGAALLGVLVWKQAIVLPSLSRRLLRRRTWDRSVLWGAIAALALLAGLALGLAWTLNVITFDFFWGYSPMNVHVALGILLLPFVGVHARKRRRQNAASAPLRTRRTLLWVSALGVATVAGWQAIERVAALTLRPGERLATGSKHVVSFSGNAYPAEIWLLDPVPLVDRDAWRLTISRRGEVLALLSYRDLEALPMHELDAVLDCTGGWWTEQAWRGWPLSDVLHSVGVGAAAGEVAVESITGHRCVYPIEDLQDALLVTHVGGEELSPGHGYPVRLIVPGRRGYQWVKWVDRIHVS
jgi:DMSO/TMAO reductase YedYZ molybdopterin-dependent catalytic subunit